MKQLLLLTVAIAAQVSAWADGGALCFRKQAGGLVISVFTSPSPLSIGVADISVLVQNQDGLDPLLDADVHAILRDDSSGVEFQARLTREQARNKLLYAAPVMFSRPGRWQIAVTVERNTKQSYATGILEVTSGQHKAVSYAGYIAFPPVMIVLFVIRERLISRRSRQRRARR